MLRALPGVHDLLVTVARGLIARALSTSPGVPGPHDFSVRSSAVRPTTGLRPSHSNPTFVTVAKRPSIRIGTEREHKDESGRSQLPPRRPF